MPLSSNKKYLAVFLMLFISGVISWQLYFKKYLQADTVTIHNFPKKIEGWTAKDLPISQADYDVLETKNVFVRRYTHSSGKEAYLFIVYSQNNRKVSHPPEICYTGSGISLLEHALDKVPVDSEGTLLEANRLLLERGSTRQVAYYWFKVGDAFTASYWKQQMLILMKSIMGKPASSALIRVSVTVLNNDTKKATEETKEFISLVLPYLLQYLP